MDEWVEYATGLMGRWEVRWSGGRGLGGGGVLMQARSRGGWQDLEQQVSIKYDTENMLTKEEIRPSEGWLRADGLSDTVRLQLIPLHLCYSSLMSCFCILT